MVITDMTLGSPRMYNRYAIVC